MIVGTAWLLVVVAFTVVVIVVIIVDQRKIREPFLSLDFIRKTR